VVLGIAVLFTSGSTRTSFRPSPVTRRWCSYLPKADLSSPHATQILSVYSDPRRATLEEPPPLSRTPKKGTQHRTAPPKKRESSYGGEQSPRHGAALFRLSVTLPWQPGS